MKPIQEADIKGKKVFLRCGFDVPIKDGQVAEDSRIRASLPTIEYLQKNNASQIFIGTHLGRPKGKEDPGFSLRPVAEKLTKLCKQPDYKKKNLKDLGYPDFSWSVYQIEPNIILLENLRFSRGEELNSEDFAKKLASLADIYVNDAFSVDHRSNASVDAITNFLPSFAGLSLQKEIEENEKLTKDPARPFGVIIGGAKAEDKLPAIKNLSTLADFFLLGGVVANTFLVARGHNIGKSLYDKELVKEAKKIWTQVMDDPKRDIFLPRDFVVSKSLKGPKEEKVVSLNDIEQIKDSDYSIVDIGPKTCELYKAKIKDAKTIFWNGNLGITEVAEFSNGSDCIAHGIIDANCYSVIGGGDTGAFIYEKGMGEKFNFISTGGGATLEYLSGKQLPGIKALEN